MFSHPAAPPPPQPPRDSQVAGDPELDERWSAVVTDWQPQGRLESPAQWSWLRWAWEQLDGRLPAQTPTTTDTSSDDDELALLDACLALLSAFLRTADGEALRGDQGADAVARELAARCGTTLCFAQLWSLARPEELQEDPWAEAGLTDPTAAASGESAAVVDVPGEEALRRPLFPLDSDDIAWIVSGSMTAAKDRTWQWFSGVATGPAQG